MNRIVAKGGLDAPCRAGHTGRVRRSSFPLVLAAMALAACALGALGTSLAAGGSADSTDAVLASLEADPAHKALTADAVRQARSAEERATRMRQAGDEERAKILDGVAAEWAALGRDLVRASQAEERAARARRNADDAGAQAERERALLDEGIAQNGRLKAQIEEASHEGKEEPARTSKLGASLDAGAPRPFSTKGAASKGAAGARDLPGRGAVDGGAP